MSEKHRDDTGKATRSVEVPYEGTARRGFFTRLCAGTIAALLGLIPLGLGVGFFFDPLIRRGRQKPTAEGDNERQDDEGFIRLDIGVSALPEDGVPIAYKVQSDKVDAWNRFPNVEIGTVWLSRTGPDEVVAFSSVCPHLGCAIDYRSANSDFFCPCHTSAFDLDGERKNLIPPRGMDQLEVRLKPETGDTIWLKYQNFRAATPEKIVVS